MKKIFILLMVVVLLIGGCSKEGDIKSNSVVIYSSAEEYRNQEFSRLLNEKFPEYNIVIEYMPTGEQAARLLSEGENTQADISIDMEKGYYEQLSPVMADLSDYDTSIYVEALLDKNNKFLPEALNGGCIAINEELLTSMGLPIPTSYVDLLDPIYKGLISMPNPKTSGTGYMFYKNIVNTEGEEEALNYFEDLSKNISQFTSSGSGPVNMLLQKEAAIGLAMTAQAVTENNNGANLKILFFDEGSPYSVYGMGIIDAKKDRAEVKEVFNYFVEVLIPNDKEKFIPEKIYKDKDYVVEGFPKNIQYADMGDNSFEEKTRLLDLWRW